MDEKEMIKKIHTVKKLKQKRATITTDIQAIEEEIKKHMEKKKLEECSVSLYTVRYQTIYTNRFDVTTFKNENKNIYKQYLTPHKTKRLTIL